MQPIRLDPRRRSAVLLVIALALAAFLAACDIASPELPQFTVILNIPFERQEVLMEELVEEDGVLQIDGEGGLFIFLEGDSLRVEMEQDLIVDMQAQDFSVELGSFEIEAGDPVTREFELIELYPEAGDLPPGLVPVPPFEFDLNPEPQDIGGIQSAHLEAGTLRVVLFNDLQVPLSGTDPPQTLYCDLKDSATGELLQTVVFDEEIAPGVADTAYVDMAGKTLPDSVALHIWGGSPGHPGVEDVDAHRQIHLEAGFLDMTVDHAVAEVGPQSFGETRVVDLDDSLRIVEAEIQSGILDLSLVNGTSLPCRVDLVFDEVFAPGGAPVSAFCEMDPGGEAVLQMDLADATIMAPGEEALSSLQYRIDVTSPGSEGTVVILNASDAFQSTLPAAEFQMSECTGYFPEKVFELDPVIEEIDLPDELAGVHFTAASLIIDVFNETGVPGELGIVLESTKQDGSTARLEHSAEISAAPDRVAMLTKIILDESNSNIQELLSGGPQSFEMTGTVRVGGPDVLGTARPGQGATVVWNIEAPLRATIEATEIEKDPFELDVDDSMRENIEDHLASALLYAEIENGLPLDMEIHFLVGPDSATVHEQPARVIGPFTVAGAPVGAQGYASEALQQTSELDLDREDVLAMTAEGSYLAVVVSLPGTGGEEIALRSTDHLSLRGLLEIEVKTTD